MKRTMKQLLGLLLLGGAIGFASATTVHAQTPDPSATTHKPDPQRMQQLLQKIEQVKYARMKEQLGMDDKQAKEFLQTYKPAEQDIQSLVRQRNEVLVKIRQFGNGGQPGSDVDVLMQQARDLTGQIQQRQIKLNTDLKPTLSPQQRARLLVFEQQFNTRIRAQVLRHRLLRNHQQLRKQIHELRKLRQMLRNRKHR